MADPIGGDGIRYTLKELLDQVNGQFKEIQGELKTIKETQTATRTDFKGFEFRVREHEALPGHPQTVTAVTALEHDVEALKAEVSRAVKSSLDAAAERDEAARQAAVVGRRWLIGLGVTILIFVAGIAVKLFVGAG